MVKRKSTRPGKVHCRTGSLEIRVGKMLVVKRVHCRTGSLEIGHADPSMTLRVHCRTGSLEKLAMRTD